MRTIARSRSLRHKIRALDAVTEDESLIDVGGPVNRL
jgi:hypothetical protein